MNGAWSDIRSHVIGRRSDVIDLARFFDVRMIPSEWFGSTDPNWKAR
jgi:hypothetical protein